jgi:hypothetical protein
MAIGTKSPRKINWSFLRSVRNILSLALFGISIVPAAPRRVRHRDPRGVRRGQGIQGGLRLQDPSTAAIRVYANDAAKEAIERWSSDAGVSGIEVGPVEPL